MVDYIGDPSSDTMTDRIESKLRDLILAEAELNGLKVVYRGEPGWIPTHLYPFGIIFLTDVNEATSENGYDESTGMRYYRYDGYIAIETLHKDAASLVPAVDRRADVPSYLDAKRFTQASFNAIMTWGGPGGNLENSPVISQDGREETIELRSDTINNGIAKRSDNISNRGSFSFHVFSRRLNY